MEVVLPHKMGKKLTGGKHKPVMLENRHMVGWIVCSSIDTKRDSIMTTIHAYEIILHTLQIEYLIIFVLDRNNLIPQVITDGHKVMTSIYHAANDDHIY